MLAVVAWAIFLRSAAAEAVDAPPNFLFVLAGASARPRPTD
jgi:hypothetical protein